MTKPPLFTDEEVRVLMKWAPGLFNDNALQDLLDTYTDNRKLWRDWEIAARYLDLWFKNMKRVFDGIAGGKEVE